METTQLVAKPTVDPENMTLREQNAQLSEERDQFKASSEQSKAGEQAALALAARVNRDVEEQAKLCAEQSKLINERDAQIKSLREMVQVQQSIGFSGNITSQTAPRSPLSQLGHFAHPANEASATSQESQASIHGLQQQGH